MTLDRQPREASGRLRLAGRTGRDPTTIKVIGVGGAGGNAVNHMIEEHTEGVEFLTANTDRQMLDATLAPTRLQLGKSLTGGMGTGSDPELGRRCAEESREELRMHLAGTDMVFITAGMGGGTGTGAAPIIADTARELGCLTVTVITRPFDFEGKACQMQAEEGVRALRHVTDALVIIPNQRLLQVLDRGTSLRTAFRVVDDVLREAVENIANLVVVPGLINLDFADVRAVMKGVGLAVMGTGSGRGDRRAIEAAHLAISSPLLQGTSIDAARAVLLNITGGPNMSLHEVHDAASVIRGAVHEDADVIFGAACNDRLEDELRVALVASRFSHRGEGASAERKRRSRRSLADWGAATTAGGKHVPSSPSPPTAG